VRDDDFQPLIAAKKYTAPEDIYAALGRNDLQVETVAEYLLPVLQNRGDILEILRQEGTPENGHPEALSTTPDGKSMKNLAFTSVKLAHCCCPIPGDAIVGFFNPGKGMFVHQSDCRTLRRYREHARARFVEVNWLQIEPQQYLAPITIVARDRAGLLRDVAAVVTDAGINMTAVTSTTNASLQKAIITATLEIETVDQIDSIFKRLRQVKNVVSVSRTPANGAPISRHFE
jgi:GTP pyrophosphokinase